MGQANDYDNVRVRKTRNRYLDFHKTNGNEMKAIGSLFFPQEVDGKWKYFQGLDNHTMHGCFLWLLEII